MRDLTSLGVSLDFAEATLRDYIKENDIPWRQIFSNPTDQNSVSQQYGIRTIPAPWLIDREGKLITHKARGMELERLVAEAVKAESANE